LRENPTLMSPELLIEDMEGRGGGKNGLSKDPEAEFVYSEYDLQ
jgi:hypothetical protein